MSDKWHYNFTNIRHMQFWKWFLWVDTRQNRWLWLVETCQHNKHIRDWTLCWPYNRIRSRLDIKFM